MHEIFARPRCPRNFQELSLSRWLFGLEPRRYLNIYALSARMRETKGGGLKNPHARRKFVTPSREAIRRAGCINYILFSLTPQRPRLIACGLPRRPVINEQCFRLPDHRETAPLPPPVSRVTGGTCFRGFARDARGIEATSILFFRKQRESDYRDAEATQV